MNDTKKKPGKLVIVRHGESEWNASGRWTGKTDIGLTDKGHADAQLMGHKLKDTQLHRAMTSDLKRTIQTMQSVLKAQGQTDVPHTTHPEIAERDYGEYTGLNKWEVKEKVGDEVFNGIRRGWDHPVPGGETLKDVHGRVVPFFMAEVVPRLHQGENVLMVAHGNSIRALMKHIEDIPEDKIGEVEFVFGTVMLYDVDHNGKLVKKEQRNIDTEATHA